MLQLPRLLAQAAASNEDYWSGEFFGLEQDQRFVLLIIGIGCATAVIISVSGIAAGVYASVTRRRAEHELKQELLDRGMSAEEIVEVIKAAPIEDAASRWVEGWREKSKAK